MTPEAMPAVAAPVVAVPEVALPLEFVPLPELARATRGLKQVRLRTRGELLHAGAVAGRWGCCRAWD